VEILEVLVSSHEQYSKQLPTILRLIQFSKNRYNFKLIRLQTLKDILLYCKSCLTLTTPPITKLLSVQLVRDIIEQDPAPEDTMKLVEQILLKKIVEVCLNQRRNSTEDLSNFFNKIGRRSAASSYGRLFANMFGGYPGMGKSQRTQSFI
jgi:hypothetical protein